MPVPLFRGHTSAALISLFVATVATVATAATAAMAATAGTAFAASCDKCPERSVSLYDFEVTAPRPDSLADMVEWYSLFYAAPGAAATIFTPQCARFIDGSFYRDASGVPSNSLTVGIDHPNTAPSGGLKGMDYLLNGTVSPDGSGYQLTMSLECACSRKKVITASGHFDRADQASAMGAELASQKFVPIAEIIREYEQDARDRDPNVSIGGYNAELIVEPAKRKAALNEKVSVTLTLTDCDGEPLAGRKISLTGGGNKLAPPSTNGAFAASEATTGSDGKVTVDFVVGSTRGIALARAYFFHQTPFGCEAVALDETAIEVDGTAPYYQVRYKYEETWVMTTKYEESPTPTWTKSSLKVDSRRTVFSGSAVFKNLATQFSGGLIELEGAGLEGGLMNGSYQENIHFTAQENYSDAIATIRRGNFEDRNTEGAPFRSGSESPDFFVSIDSEDPNNLSESSQFSFTIPFALKGSITGQGFEVIHASGQVFDTSWSVDETFTDETVFGPNVSMINSYSSKDSSFHVDGSLDTSWSANGSDTKVRASFAATVTPIAVGPKPDAVLPVSARGRERIRILNGGALVACRLQDIPPGTRVQVGVYSVRGALLAMLHDAPRSGNGDITLSLDPGRRKSGTGLSLVVLRAGNMRESRVLVRNTD